MFSSPNNYHHLFVTKTNPSIRSIIEAMWEKCIPTFLPTVLSNTLKRPGAIYDNHDA